MSKLSLQQMLLTDKKVLMRVDFNVPITKSGEVADGTRIIKTLPSIRYILEQKPRYLILMSHLGQPKGKVSKEFSLAPCATYLSTQLGLPVIMAQDCVGEGVKAQAQALPQGAILLLENLRFHRGEEHPEEEPSFATELSGLADLYINDAFGSCHRPHASITHVAKFFPHLSGSGLLLEKEIYFLSTLLSNPPRPFYALIGGAKISSKLAVLKRLLEKVDGLLIGGAMAYTFLKAQGISIGDSLYEPDLIEEAKKIIEQARSRSIAFLLPIDHRVVEDPSSSALPLPTQGVAIPEGKRGVDIGIHTETQFLHSLHQAATLFWNGPLGIFENPHFAQGTLNIARQIAQMKAIKIIGGGDSLAAVEAAGVAEKMTHLSTGGGASLEFLERGSLPGIEALTDL